jgi:REP element-mobilizing transposase RayT
MHVTMKSSQAVGRWSMLKPEHARLLRALVPLLATRFHVQLYEVANVGNHLHLVVRARTREGFKGFLMALSGRITQQITGAKKGNPLEKRFFDSIPFSRILEWGRDFKNAIRYVIQNTLEAAGEIPFQPRARRTGAKRNRRIATS